MRLSRREELFLAVVLAITCFLHAHDDWRRGRWVPTAAYATLCGVACAVVIRPRD